MKEKKDKDRLIFISIIISVFVLFTFFAIKAIISQNKEKKGNGSVEASIEETDLRSEDTSTLYEGDDLVSDEDASETETVYDTATGYLMYKGIYYAIPGSDGEPEYNEENAYSQSCNLAAADYYDIDMENLDIPDYIEFNGNKFSITSILHDAFSYDTMLTGVKIASGISAIGDNAFMGCDSINAIEFGSQSQDGGSGTDIENSSLVSIGAHVFDGCTALKTITVPDSVTAIGDDAFNACTGLISITLPSNLLTIGTEAFFGCSQLTSVSIPSKCTSLSEGMFTNCESLSEVDLGDKLQLIGDSAFWACHSLNTVTIPSTVIYIGTDAFYDTGLKSVIIKADSITLGDDIFDYSNDLETIIVPKTCQKYYESLFSGYNVEESE